MKKKIFKCFKLEGEKLKFYNEKFVLKELSELKEGDYKFELSDDKKGSKDQFGWLYSCIYPLSLSALLDAGYEIEARRGQSVIDAVDEFWKLQLADRDIVNIVTGEIMKLPLKKELFTTLELMLYCDKIRKFCAEYLNAEIPEPDKDWRQKLQEETEKQLKQEQQ